MRFGGHFDAMATNTKQDGVLVIFWVFVHTCAVVHPDHWLSFWVFVCRCVVVHPEHMPLKKKKNGAHIVIVVVVAVVVFVFVVRCLSDRGR